MSGEKAMYTGRCHACQRIASVEVNTMGHCRRMAGKPVQECFPELPISQREFLISNLCEECQEKFFPRAGECNEVSKWK